MKQIYLVGGTMGVGKTHTCQLLKQMLDRSVFLDGDWCWDAHPFQVTEETKMMVMENICFLLNQFIHCSAYQHIIFCWVMHEQPIVEEIVSRLDTQDCAVHCISLVCGEEALRKRLQRDVSRGIRKEEVIERSVARLALYEKLNTVRIDVSEITPQEAAEQIRKIGENQDGGSL